MRWVWGDEPNISFAWSEVEVVQRHKPSLIPEESVFTSVCDEVVAKWRSSCSRREVTGTTKY